MRIRQETLDDLLTLAASDYERCACNHPNAHPPCGYCTHPGNPAVLETVEAWESEADWKAYWAMIDAAHAFLTPLGFRRLDRDYEYDNLEQFTIGIGWDEDLNKPKWYAKTLRRFSKGRALPIWRADFDTVEAAYTYGVIQKSLEGGDGD